MAYEASVDIFVEWNTDDETLRWSFDELKASVVGEMSRDAKAKLGDVLVKLVRDPHIYSSYVANWPKGPFAEGGEPRLISIDLSTLRSQRVDNGRL